MGYFIAIISTLVVFSILSSGHGATIQNSKQNSQHASSDELDGILTATDTSDYFISFNAAGFNKAKKDCQKRGAGWNLLKIEEQDELQEISDKIEDDDQAIGGEYWTAGRFDDKKESWTWDIVNGPLLNYTAPWGEGFPGSVTFTSRIVLLATPVPQFLVDDTTVAYRYICEKSKDDC